MNTGFSASQPRPGHFSGLGSTHPSLSPTFKYTKSGRKEKRKGGRQAAKKEGKKEAKKRGKEGGRKKGRKSRKWRKWLYHFLAFVDGPLSPVAQPGSGPKAYSSPAGQTPGQKVETPGQSSWHVPGQFLDGGRGDPSVPAVEEKTRSHGRLRILPTHH